ncbi:MAG: hypothetical protein ACRCVT_09585 [Leadbetterella sp.]
MRILICLVFFILNFYGANSQSLKEIVSQDTISKKMLAYGAYTSNHSSLLGGLVLRSSISHPTKDNVNRYFYIDLTNIKNYREINNTQYQNTAPYVFGKRNYFFVLRPQYGKEVRILNSVNTNNPNFSYIIAAGPSFGLQKPYLIKYGDIKNPLTEQFDPLLHDDLNKIYGKAPFSERLFKDIQIIPGINVKAAINLDINLFGSKVSGLELGIIGEYFFKEPEIFAPKFAENEQLFAHVYLSLYFGNEKLVSKFKRKKKSDTGSRKK